MTALRESVRSTWLAYNKPHEGRYPCMYRDSKGRVATAVGYDLPKVEDALALPWTDKDTGMPASGSAIRAEYAKVDGMASLIKDGANAAMKATRLRLSEATIDRICLARLDAMVAHLADQFPAFPTWPADAQRVLCSISWAAGSTIIPKGKAKGWPKLAAHLQREDFASAADEVKLSESLTQGVANRNLSNIASMKAAAAVVARGADPDVLYLTPDAVPGADPEPVPDTEPSHDAREAYAASVLGTRATVAEMSRGARDRDDG